MLSFDRLLQPIRPDQPCGEDLAFSAEMDAIAQARVQDDPALDQGVWVTTLRQADWQQVATRCAALIETRSKDLRLAVWLAEALASTHGARGLGDGYALLAGLCEQFWDDLYPLAEQGDYEQRSGNLHWLLARTPALLQQWQQQHGKVLPADADYCAAMLQQLERVAGARFASQAPGFSAAREAMHALALDGAALAGGDALLPVSVTSVASSLPAAVSGAIQNRQQALAELRRVAAFFRASEPHSPVAYLAEKAACWGEMPLHRWLQEVLQDGATLTQLEKLLGVLRTE